MLTLLGMRKADAVAHFGNQRKLAAALGITEQAVALWNEIIPEGRAYQLESITHGKLKVQPSAYRPREAHAQ